MREKHIEEKFPLYFRFGKSPEGKVDIASAKCDTVASVSEKEAIFLIQERDEAISMITNLVNELDIVDPEALDRVWYGS